MDRVKKELYLIKVSVKKDPYSRFLVFSIILELLMICGLLLRMAHI